jgi:Family of unknown function (DUF6252)
LAALKSLILYIANAAKRAASKHTIKTRHMRLLPTLSIILTCIILTASNCKKNKPDNPVDQLPPETQIGANTFGCLVNGQVFKPGGAQLSGGSLSCNYQYLNGGYYFRLVGVNDNSVNRKSIGIFTDSLRISEGATLILEKPFVKSKAYGLYSYSKTQPFLREDYETSEIYKGEIKIKKLDPVNQIVSGTFWFDAVNGNGQKAEVREGRFDVRYTQ